MAGLLGPAQIRERAEALGKRPTKTLGQNFVHDASTVRKIVAEASLHPDSAVLEVGPGLGSLTLGLLEAGAFVSAVEIDPVLAQALPTTVAEMIPEAAERFAVLRADALEVASSGDLAVPPAWQGEFAPKYLVANLPYNVAVPILFTLLEALPSIEHVTVMVQAEVADRLAARPGNKTYGVPSVKAAWYGDVRRGVKISRNVFWPVPNVDSALVHLDVTVADEPVGAPADSALAQEREELFALVDAAFSQRRKTLRSALGMWAGSPARAELILREAGIDPRTRGEQLDVDGFLAIVHAQRRVAPETSL